MSVNNSSNSFRRNAVSGGKDSLVDEAALQDDKQSKADQYEVQTGKFVVGLLLVCCMACAYLILSHMSKPVESVSSGGGASLREVLVGRKDASTIQAESVPLQSINSVAQFSRINESPGHIKEVEQTVSALNEQNQRIDRSKERSDSYSNSKPQTTSISWQGCSYELPDPITPPIQSLAIETETTQWQRKNKNKKNMPGYDYNREHIVPPPEGEVTLVCCNTTKGPLNIEVHPTWAPNGARRFLEMVNDGFFASEVGLFRALKDFLVQFGLPGDPALLKKYHQQGNLVDDPPWLPLGPTGREINGTKRFQKGYLAYAGAGKNSRGTQLIMAFQDNLYLGGGSPWEVPFAQVYGARSFETLGKIYTGYGEKPSQGKIMNRGVAYLREDFPLLDYINNCAVMKEHVRWSYVHPHPYY